VKIVVVKFTRPFTPVSSNLCPVASGSDVVEVVVPDDPSATLPSVNRAGKLESACINNCVVLHETEIAAAELRRLRPRHVPPRLVAGNRKEHRIPMIIRAAILEQIVIYHAAAPPRCNVVVLKSQIVEVTVV